MKNLFWALNIIASLALAVLTGYFFVVETEAIIQSFALQITVYVALCALCLFLSYIFHELGHVLFGAITKMGVKLKSVSPFSSAFSCSVNPKTDKNIKPRYLITVIGGLLVNLLLIVVGATGLIFSALIWVSPFLPASFYVFILNLLPLEYASGKTDGLIALELIKNEDSAKVLLVLLTVQGKLNCGIPLKNISENLLLNLPQLPEDDYNFIVLTQLRAEYYAATGDSEKYEKYRQRYEQLKEYLN
ncbi:MAG: hypothetical protein J6B04_01395 [Clostridia bacterium]|nr:hypothetical protein [Clostridia bacterium]